MFSDRFLIYAAIGSLDDAFYQIERCWRYVEKWDLQFFSVRSDDDQYILPLKLLQIIVIR